MCNPVEAAVNTWHAVSAPIADPFNRGDVSNAFVGVRDAVVTPITNTVTAISRDPIGTLLPIAVSVASGGTIPPYVTAAAITASRGGNIGQIATTALISYGAQQLASTQFGGEIDYNSGVQVGGTSLNDLTSSIAGQLDVSPGVQAAVTSGLNNATFNALLAVAQGKPVATAIGAGFVGGALGSGINQVTTSGLGYFKDPQGARTAARTPAPQRRWRSKITGRPWPRIISSDSASP